MAGFKKSLSYEIIHVVSYIFAWKWIHTLVPNSCCGKLGEIPKQLRGTQFTHKAYI